MEDNLKQEATGLKTYAKYKAGGTQTVVPNLNLCIEVLFLTDLM